jgi:hypothetical protein
MGHARSIRAVRRYPVLLATLMVLLLAAVPRLRALTDEEKKEAFLEARGDSDSDASPSASPHHRRHSEAETTPRHRHSPTPEADETATPEETPEPDETPRHRHHPTGAGKEETPARKHHHPSPTPDPAPRRHNHLHEEQEQERTPIPIQHPETPSPLPAETAVPEEHPVRTPIPLFPQASPSGESASQSVAVPVATPLPAARPQPTPAPTPAPGPWGDQIDIQKQGLEEEGGFEPPPPPPRHHWWQFFGGAPEPQYRFLTPAIRAAIDRAPVARRRWRFIVVHNSGTRQGNARIFDYYHRYVRKMPNGLAYHFVIGNGTSSGNGQIEIGNRWTRQINGGHVHSDYLNNIALGICLVGDFNRDLPTKEQLEALDELIRYLRIRVGKIDGKPAIVKAHKEINPPQWPTDCPGDRFPYHWLHSRFD